MKKTLIALALCAISTSSMAQWSFGVKAGVNSSTVSKPLEEVIDAHHRWGVLIGGMASYQLNRDFDLQGELFYAKRGFKTDIYVDLSEEAKPKDWYFDLHYIDMPIMLKYHPLGSIVYAEMGPQVGYLIDSKNEIKDYDEETNIDDNTNKLDFGFVGGVGVDVTQHLSVGARYYLGLTKSWKGFDGGKNRSFEFSVGYWF